VGLDRFAETAPRSWQSNLVDTATTNWAALVTEGDRPYFRVDSITVVNTDSIDHVLQVAIDSNPRSDEEYGILATVVVPAGAGNGTVPVVDLLAAFPVTLQQGFAVDWSAEISFRTTVAVTTGARIGITTIGGAI
jgi:hypothetical protein